VHHHHFNAMETDLEDLVKMMTMYSDGIPVKRLSLIFQQNFHRNLCAEAMGFDSLSSLVDSLDEVLLVKDGKIFHKMHTGNSVVKPKTSKLKKADRKKIIENFLTMMKEHPKGIRLKALDRVYTEKYKKKMLLTELGFSTMLELVESLSEHLFVKGKRVIHVMFKKQEDSSNCPESSELQPAASPTVGVSLLPTKITINPNPISFKPYLNGFLIIQFNSSTKTWQACSVDELDLKVALNLSPMLQVLQKFNLDNPPMQKLQSCYLEHFGSELPFGQYLSLYDQWEMSLSTRKNPKVPPVTAASSSLLSDNDFPALGVKVSQKQSTTTETADAPKPKKSSSSNVFTEGYHRQLREVHGANMRAVEALEEIVGGPRHWSRRLERDNVDNLMKDMIREIASEGELVTKEQVISRTCQLLQISSLESAGINQWQIQALKDLQYTIREVNMFLEATASVSCVCTLYELGQALAALKDKKRYEELNLGPLCKLPLVHRMFKINSNTKDDDIQQIKTVDILQHLRNFRRTNANNRIKIDLADFMKYLSDQYNCDSPYELGIRIHSVALPISLSKVVRNENALLEKAREQVQKELEEETVERLRKMKRHVLDALPGSASGGNAELKKKYASLTAAEVVLAVFSKAEGVFSPKMTKHVQTFLLQVSGDRLATALFQLSICGGSLALPQDLVLKDKSSKAHEQTKPEKKPSTLRPTEGMVQQFVKDSLSSHNSTFTLAHMAALEKKLTKHFHLQNFLCLEMGTFLDFLVKHVQVGLMGWTCISVQLGGASFRPTRQDLFEFIKQCGDLDQTDPEQLSLIETALCSHYRLRDSRDLGFGALQRLAGLVQQQKQLSGGGLSPVYYELALLGETVGRLGDMSKDQALFSLLSCPLLEDVGQWSQWDIVFKPVYGSLKDFIERNAGTTGLSALEVCPGVLLRTTSHTGDQYFSMAAERLDAVGTAGHLVSMVVAYGVANAPLALLANHMQSSLAAAVAREDLSQAYEDVSCYRRVAEFILACLVRIPTKICRTLMQQVFMEPFSKVLGQTRSKEVLMSVAQSNPQHLNLLHRLGILLGITDWIKDYQKKLSAPLPQERQDAVLEAKVNMLLFITSGLLHVQSIMLFVNDLNAVNDDIDVKVEDEEEEEEDDEELYELASVSNGEALDHSSEGEPTPDGEESHVCPVDCRKSEFGVGVELTPEGQKLMMVHQERLGRSLDRLSTELYSKDTHFVLELIQNADDNTYALEDGVTPALAFVVERDCITVLNNETGFQEKNIRAICDVGRSTKGKHTYGYIGQKGIGFKSVFKVTDCPEIHSNGFHLRFDKTCGPMGYILPHWTEDQRDVCPLLEDISQHSWSTKICLPLRSESHQTRNLFHDVHPSLLLFLHRLRSITIYNQLENRLVTMLRKDLSHNVLEVEHTNGTERWLVIKSMLTPRKIKDGVEATELALAFQLSTEETGSEVIGQPQKQPVFAYLPLRTFGFRFIIQGDFDIPSSREDVDRDSSWNQWLRSEIPLLFLQAMEVFNTHSDLGGLRGLCHFFQFIPLPDEILDFFKPVALQIIQLLKGRAFLPTLSTDGKVVYKLPSQVAVCQDPVIREVIGGAELEKHLSLSYLHPSLSPAPPPSLLRELGVRYLRGPDVTTVTSAMAKELMKMEGIHSEDGLQKLAKLLVCNFRALEHGYGEADSILQTLRDLPIIPLSDNRVVALSTEGVFFPMEETSSPLSALYQDVCVVHPTLLSCMDPLESQQVRELLRRLGVHELEPEELLQQHIYPTIHSAKWKSKPEAVVVSYLVFIKQHSSSASLLELSDTAVPVLTSRGLLCPKHSRVYFSEEYGNMDLNSRLPGHEWVLLSPCYAQADSDVAGWRELFTKLGVRDGFIIRKERRTLTPKELASSPWSVESSMWPQSRTECCVIDDYPCEELYSLATAQLPDHLLHQQRAALLELLANNWDSGYDYLTAQVIDSDGQSIKSIRSSFYYHLCRLEWVPAHRPLQNGQEESSFLCPSSVYVSSEEIRRLLGTHVWYVDIQPSDFTRALGMRNTVTVESLISYLKEWCMGTQAEGEEPEGLEFTSTVEHIHNVYSYLHKNCSQIVLKELFQQTPAVYNGGNYWCLGQFYHLKDVCWSDPTSMFHRYKSLTQSPSCPMQNPRVLAPFYSSLEGMKDFFTRLLRVDMSPNIKQYVGLLEAVCSSCPIPTSEVLQDVSVLYATLGKDASSTFITQPRLNTGYCSTLKGMVSDLRVFPTKDNTWVTLSRRPMVSDSRELEKVFKAHKELCLLNLPPAEKNTAKKTWSSRPGTQVRPAFREEDRSLFLHICGIKQLSACVTSEAQTENLRPCPSMQETVRSIVPYIQRFLYHREDLAEVYSELQESNIAHKIKKLYFGQVGKLYRRYQLDLPDSGSIVELEDVICLLKDNKELYIQKDHLEVFLSDQKDLVAIGEWGERLVHSFLVHWRDGPDPARPSSISWCNERGESGQPYDFQLSFAHPHGDTTTVFIEVKSTVKTEKALMHMSANELDFALKKKEHYHIYRVYSAGDAQHVRLCRIQNLAQHLHTKNLELYLFV
uniref:HTH OST-type domain-containing protein n=1 Tax=Periophthalmus magnuspinnatus TaxID=409849 RepID=A0A3B4B300_9GOBI